MGGLLTCCKKDTKPTSESIQDTSSKSTEGSKKGTDEIEIKAIKPSEDPEVKIYSKYSFENDKLFENIESKKQLNFLGEIDFSDYMYSLSEFSLSTATIPEDYSKKPLSYSKNDVWFRESISESLWQSFIENKIYKHPKLYTRVGENEIKAQICKEVLIKMYAALDQKMNQSNKDKGLEKDNERIKKYHLVAFGLLYCAGKSATKIKILFDLFKENDKLKNCEDFKDFLLALFLVPAYCLYYARKKSENYDEVGGAVDSETGKKVVSTMELRDSMNLVDVTIKQIFGEDNHEITYQEFVDMFKESNGCAYLIQPKGVRELLVKNDITGKK